MSKAIRNVAFGLLGFAWPVALLLVSTPILLRGLGEEGFGVQALVINVIGYLTIFNSMQGAGTKYLSEFLAKQERENITKLLSTSLFFNLGVGIVGGLAIFLGSSLLVTRIFRVPDELVPASTLAFQLASIGFVASTISWWGTAVMAGLQRYDVVSGIAILVVTFSTLGSLLALVFGFGLVGVVVSNVVGALIGALAYGLSVKRGLPWLRWEWRFDKKMFRLLFGFGIFATIQVIFGLISVQMDRTLLGLWIGVGAVAIYTIPWGLTTRIQQLCSRALQVVFPLTSELNSQQRGDQLMRLFLRAQTLNTVLVILIGMPLLLLARDILTQWMGTEFAEQATLALELLTIAYGLYSLCIVLGGIIWGLGHPEVYTGFSIALALANLIGYVLFIPRWAVDGAAWGSMLSSLVVVPPLFWYVNRRFLHVPWRTLLTTVFGRPLLAALPVAIFLWLAKPLIVNSVVLLVMLAIACAGYLGLTIPVGVWDRDEVAFARRLLLKLKTAVVSRKLFPFQHS